jgi:hypothetical protein
MASGGCVTGAIIGGLIDGTVGALAWGIVGVVVGALLGILMGGYAWVLESPLKGAVRTGGLMAAVMVLLLLVPAWRSGGNLSRLFPGALLTAAVGGVTGALMGAFLGWIAGPILREMVQKMDRGDSHFQH